MSINNKKPEAADIHIGARVKERRTLIGMSQEKLGEQLGITFQQVQKYEKGANRIGAGRLYSISEVLGTPVGFFYEGLEGRYATGMSEGDEQPALAGAPKGDATARLARDFGKIADPEVRRTILDLVRTLAAGPEAPSSARTRR